MLHFWTLSPNSSSILLLNPYCSSFILGMVIKLNGQIGLRNQCKTVSHTRSIVVSHFA